jgi:uncharacterized protein
VSEQILFSIVLAIVAAAYAAVGQGGATGYVAVMGLIGFGPDVIRPTALTLNMLVSAIGTVQFARAGLLTWRNFYPFAMLGVPCSVLGGATHLSASVYHPVVGFLLLVAAWQMARSARLARGDDDVATKPPPLLPSVLGGAGIGFVAGVTGIGGGILLAPLMLTLGWAGPRQTSAVSAAFNLLNSAAALVGLWLQHRAFPLPSPWWLAAVACGGLLGSWLGVRGLPSWFLRYALAALLLIAGVRMLLS